MCLCCQYFMAELANTLAAEDTQQQHIGQPYWASDATEQPANFLNALLQIPAN